MQIFISYSRAIPFIAEATKSFLESQGYTVWMDQEDIVGGAKWKEKIKEAVKSSFAMLVLVTKPAIESEWIKREILEAKYQQRTIIPLLMEKLDNTSESLRSLGIADYHLINYVAQRKESADPLLVAALKSAYNEWLKIFPHIQKIYSEDEETIADGIYELSKTRGDPSKAIQLLLPYLKHEKGSVRAAAVYTLSELGDESVIGNLIDYIEAEEELEEEDYDRYYSTQYGPYVPLEGAIEALGLIGGHEAIDFLKKRVRECSINGEPFDCEMMALGLTKDSASVEFIASMLYEIIDEGYVLGNPLRMFSMIYALGVIGDPQCVPVLCAYLDRVIALIKAGFDAEDIERLGEIRAERDDFIPNFEAYQIFEILEIDEEYIEDYRFHIITVTVLILEKLGDIRAIPTLRKLLGIRHLHSFQDDSISWYAVEFIEVTRNALHTLNPQKDAESEVTDGS